jgi:hypothetical protein
MRFPTLETFDSRGATVIVPDHLPRGSRLIYLAFMPWHQTTLESWDTALATTLCEHEGISVWEIAVLAPEDSSAQAFIDGGVRSASMPALAWARTLATRSDPGALALDLRLVALGELGVFLVDEFGEVLWQASGDASADSVRSLGDAMRGTDLLL